MTYNEAEKRANRLYGYVGKPLGRNNLRVMIITPAPTDTDECASFVARIGTPPYMDITEALTHVKTHEFDVIIIFENTAPDVAVRGWAENYIPDY
jgi:hypothetical protein